MKKEEKLQKAYLSQKETYDRARTKRMTARTIAIKDIDTKIAKLQARRLELEKQNQDDKEFESFESFRLRAESQSTKTYES